MERTDALILLEKISGFWSHRLTNSNHDMWMDVLVGCEDGRAGTAFARLKNKATHMPSPADFMAEYRSLVTTRPSEGVKCQQCHDNGWVTDTNHPHHWPGEKAPVLYMNGEPAPDECICNVVRACVCPAGRYAVSA